MRIYPGISSVSYFAALAGYSYQDAAVLSIHGHGAETEWIGNLTETIRFSKKTFFADVRKRGCAKTRQTVTEISFTEL